MGGKKKYINIFGSFTESFNCKNCKTFQNQTSLFPGAYF